MDNAFKNDAAFSVWKIPNSANSPFTTTANIKGTHLSMKR